MSSRKKTTTFGTEHLLAGLCDSVSKVLTLATHSEIRYSGMVQKIGKTCLKPDLGCFVLFDGGFSGLVIINFTAQAAMELYARYMLNMGMDKASLASAFTADEVGNTMGELMNQIVGDFTGKIGRELQTHITQNQPKMLAINKQVMLSVDANLDQPEARRVTLHRWQQYLLSRTGHRPYGIHQDLRFRTARCARPRRTDCASQQQRERP